MAADKLSPEQEKWKNVYLKGGTDPLWWAKTFFPKAFSLPFADFHKDIIEAYFNDDLKKVIILAPRKHAKSELGAFLLPFHSAFYHPQVKNGGVMAIVSATEDTAIDRVETIKREVENNKLLNAFYGSLKGDKWQSKQISLQNKEIGVDTTIFAKGMGQQFRGVKKGHRRPYFIFLDDVEPEEECRNNDLVLHNLRWLEMVVEPALADNGRMFFLATIMAEESMTHKISKSKSWFTMLYSVVNAKGDMLWKEKMDEKVFREKYFAAKEYNMLDQFWLEYMNLPFNPQNKELTHANILHFDNSYLENKVINNYILIDPAFSSEKTSDYTGIAVVGIDDDKNYFVHKVSYSNAKDPKSIVEEVIPLITEFYPMGVFVESFGAQISLISAMQLLMKEYNVACPVFPMKGKYVSGAKTIRIRNFISEIKKGKVFFSRDTSVFSAIRDFLSFPEKIGGGHYDVIDAISYSKQVAVAPKVFRSEKRKTDWDLIVEQVDKMYGKGRDEEILSIL